MSLDGSVPEQAGPRLTFAWAGDFSEGLAPVKDGGRFGYIDTSGALRIAAAFDYAGGFSGGRAPVLLGGKWGYLDATGRMAIPAVYDWSGNFREGLAPVSSGGEYGFIDSNGAFAGPLRFSDARPYSGGYAAVRIGDEENGAWGFVDRAGRLAIPPLFNDVPGGFSEGFAVVRMENERPFRSGYVDSSGGFAFDTLYDAAGDFREGLAPVGRGEWRGNRFQGSWGYVDTTGRPVIGITFAEAGPFQRGKALVRLQDGSYARIGRDGRVLDAFREDLEILPGSSGGMLTYMLHKRFGFLDPGSGASIDPVFADAGEFRQGWARVRLAGAGGGMWAYIDGNGRYLGNGDDPAAR
ncbi:MAG: Leptospira [Fibrobacteres bacterium]|nr:Leptospira [Fibrobacterota bacterium]